MSGHSAHHAADDALGVLDGDSPFTALHQDDESHNRQHEDQHEQYRHRQLQTRVTKTFSYRSAMARGRPTTIPVKMSSDMPLPMPRAVICSPSHMMNIAPAVKSQDGAEDKHGPGLTTSDPGGSLPLECNGDTKCLERASPTVNQRVFGDFPPAQFALFLEFLQGRRHHGQKLENY